MAVLETDLRTKVAKLVVGRTARRVVGLEVELSDGQIVLRGTTDTFHVKQLAQEAVRELIPDLRLFNRIVVTG